MVANLTLAIYFLSTSGIINQFNFWSLFLGIRGFLIRLILGVQFVFLNWMCFNGRPWRGRTFICFSCALCEVFCWPGFGSSKQASANDIRVHNNTPRGTFLVFVIFFRCYRSNCNVFLERWKAFLTCKTAGFSYTIYCFKNNKIGRGKFRELNI